MRANTILFAILAAFFFLADGIYIVWSIIDPQHPVDPGEWWDGIEWVGAIAMLLSGLLAGFIAFYIGVSSRGQGGLLPEDRLDAEIDDGEAEQGFFSPWSWWPIMMALSGSLVVTGLAIGIWIAIIGGAVLVVSVIGWQYEYYRGYFAH